MSHTINHRAQTLSTIISRDYTIYAIGPKSGAPVYIGSTYNINNRVHSHEYKRRHSDKPLYKWMRENEYIFALVANGTGNNRDRLKCEAAAIRTHTPIYNRVLPLLTDEERRAHKRAHHMRHFAIKEICECGGRTDGLHRHMHRKTKRHIAFMASKPAAGTINK